MRLEDTQGKIFNIQHYSIHDGPGIRTTVFFMGCPLRCRWCQNPESQGFDPVLFFNAEKCTGCGQCVEACPEGAIQVIEGKSKTDRKQCKGHGDCVEICPYDARSLMGRNVTAAEVFEAVKADAIFYKNSGGGVTISGGDPVAQPDFAISILKLCRDAGIHTAIETCGHAKWEILNRILEHVDLVLYDFKHMNPAAHQDYTGVSNQLILENAKRIYHALGLEMLARIPIMPDCNDSAENLKMTARFIADDMGRSVKVHLLPYHRLAETKYEMMEKPEGWVRTEPPGDDGMQEIKKMFESFGLMVTIGG
ncbi:MAG: glycyl-radical enzyme activating protein [Desulfobacterales bacterium]|nr:MAG: glycyl-radical enzyme activating protein [Desulfobacterales bacterium]